MTKQQLRNAIEVFDKKYQKNFIILWDTTHNLESTVRDIILCMFENRFIAYFSSSEEYSAYEIIYDYWSKLRKNGRFDFE